MFPAPLGQICFAFSSNHKAQNQYPEMVMARTDSITERRKADLSFHFRAGIGLSSHDENNGIQEIIGGIERENQAGICRCRLSYFNLMWKPK